MKKEIDLMPDYDWMIPASNTVGIISVFMYWNDLHVLRGIAIVSLCFYTIFVYIILFKKLKILFGELEKAKGQWER